MPQNYQMNYTNETIQRYSEVDALSTDGRIGQRQYFVYSIILPVLVFWAISALAALMTFTPVASDGLFYGLIGFAIIAMLFMTVRLTVQRCHDFNKSGTWAVLALIPFANVIFALIPSNNGLNQYGEVPKPVTLLLKATFYILIVLLITTGIYLALQLANINVF